MATGGLKLDVSEPVDVSGLIELRRLQPAGQADAVARIVRKFLDECELRLASLHAAVETADTPALERTAHALKGAAGTVGANEIGELAVRLERIGREGRAQEGAQLVQELDAALGRARPIFDRLL